MRLPRLADQSITANPSPLKRRLREKRGVGPHAKVKKNSHVVSRRPEAKGCSGLLLNTRPVAKEGWNGGHYGVK